ncbi:MAG: serine kinase [Thermoleophilia bacterium]|nr:serine kinase [Thermoleophilia bacterium]
MSTTRKFTVSAPASSGNLGPGFDVFGMALELRNLVHVRPGSGVVRVEGEGAATLPADDTNLVARAFAQAAGQSIADAEVDLRCVNRIPPARGLGSSTAAAACGLIAGWEVAGHEWGPDELDDALAELDGHPDNAAACAYGGLVLCHDRPDTPGEEAHLDVIALGPADWLRLVAVIPDRSLETSAARAVLPATYDRSVAVQAVGGAALLAAGLVGGHVELLADALHTDVLHEPQRAELVPELREVRESLAAATQALGATLSGAGPTVLAWCEPDTVDQAAGALTIDFHEHTILPLAVAEEGARVDG